MSALDKNEGKYFEEVQIQSHIQQKNYRIASPVACYKKLEDVLA
jgi:hypothetical protein